MALALLGQLLTLSRTHFMSGAHFLYYTNLSNLLVILVMAALLYFELKARRAGRIIALPAWFSRARFVAAAGILLTFAGFSLLLLPRMQADYLLSVDNLLVHNLVPLLACLDFLLFDAQPPHKPHRAWQGLALPLFYLLLILLLGLAGQRYHQNQAAPYFFMDAEQNGWLSAGQGKLGVLWWLLIITGLQLMLSRLLLGLRKLVARAE